jgi:hypothetical protein
MYTRDLWLRVLVTLGVAFVLVLLALWLLGGMTIPRANAGLARCAQVAPLPIHTDPGANALNVPITSNVSITFDEPISLTSVSTRTFAVYGSQSSILTGIYSLDSSSHTVTLDPTRALFPGERVDATVTTGTLSFTGQQAISATVWQFWATVQGGSGVFTDSGQSLGSSYSQAVALGDLDSDGDVDAFVGNAGQADRVWLNDGTGTLGSGQNLGSSDTRAVALGDVDSDGDLDAFVGNSSGEANRVWLNNGMGMFTDSGQELGNSNTHAVALGDLDGDGNLDVFIANADYVPAPVNEVWLNDGTGIFIDSGQALGSLSSRDVALGDLDSDGDLDAFVLNTLPEPAQVWLNDGTSVFTDSGQNLGSVGYHTAVALGDLDDDGDLDVFVTTEHFPGFDAANKVWLNDGTGIFTDSIQSLGDSNSLAVALGDLDGDGDLDAFVGNGGEANRVWRNNGMGIFTSGDQNLGDSASNAVALGDLDGDGDLDAFVGNNEYPGQPNKVWLNLRLDQVIYLPLVMHSFR